MVLIYFLTAFAFLASLSCLAPSEKINKLEFSATLFLAGLYMTLTVWRWVPWISVALLAMFLLPALGAANGRRIVAIEETLASEKGALSPAILQQLHAPEFWTSLRLRTAVLIGIVFLMTIKPGLVGALLTIGIALSLGVIIDKLPRPKTMAEKIAGN